MTATSDIDEPATPFRDGGLVRLRLDLSYDGTDFSGWARQPDRRTVQETLETAIATVLRLADPPALTVAGRTDAGVHASGQVAHVDVAAGVDPPHLQRRLEGLLPTDVAVNSVRSHLRASTPGSLPPGGTTAIASPTAPRPARRRDTVLWKRPLDEAAMHSAAQGLVGEHDFAAYCRPREGATTTRTLRSLDVTRDSDGVVVIAAHADAFCHNQVRAMVGALLAVGDGRDRPGGPQRCCLPACATPP